MFKSAKEIAFTGVMVALLIGGQLALSMISGVEIVTALFAVYCVVFGVFRGVVVATAFSLVRCFVFGFMPQVIILYLVYYNLFAVVLGLVSRVIGDRNIAFKIIITTLFAVLLTLCFTMIDNFLSIVFFGLPEAVKKIYVLQSIPVAIRHSAINAVTVPLMFYPLYRVFSIAKNNLYKGRILKNN